MNNTIHIIGGKSDIIKNDNADITLKFVKRYNKYYSFLSFFPTVLADMVFDYINDYFEINIWNNDGTIDADAVIILNYESVLVDFYYISISQKLLMRKLYSASYACKIPIPCRHSCQIAHFMKKYYNVKMKLPGLMAHTKCCNESKCHDNVIKHIDNHRYYKNEIIIIEKVMDYLKSIGLYTVL